MFPARNQRGFTIIELMITLIVATILVTVGVPSYFATKQNAHASALASELTSAFNLARAEAVRRGEIVRVCPSSNSTSCGGAWDTGWIALVPASGELLRVWEHAPDSSDITQSPTSNVAVEFGPLGQLLSATTRLIAAADGCAGRRARLLDLAPSGRISVSRVDC